MEQFKIGDVVVLKSGGPCMTIDYVSQDADNPGITCKWFVGHESRTEVFNEGALMKATPTQSAGIVGGSRPSGPPVQ